MNSKMTKSVIIEFPLEAQFWTDEAMANVDQNVARFFDPVTVCLIAIAIDMRFPSVHPTMRLWINQSQYEPPSILMTCNYNSNSFIPCTIRDLNLTKH